MSHTKTIHAKIDLLTMMKNKGLAKQIKCIITENMKAEGVHPLYLGLRYSKDTWKLKQFPLEKVLSGLEGGEKKASAESDKKKKGGKKDVLSDKE